MKKHRIIISGGGTGGHVYPAIALAQAISKKYTSAKILFVGTERGLEKKIVPKYEYPIRFLSVYGIKGHSPIYKIFALFKLLLSLFEAIKIIWKFRPTAVYGVGGYASAPCVIAASLMFKQVFLLEQNAIPGITNKALKYFAQKVFTGFAHAKNYFGNKGIFTGNPVREDFLNNKREENSSSNTEKTVLIYGGSQGASAINQSIKETALILKDNSKVKFIHQTGVREFPELMEFYLKNKITNIECHAFIDNPLTCFLEADLVISRAGAMTISEIIATETPSVLIPPPSAADDHQTVNARELSEQKAAILLLQEDLDPQKLSELINEVILDDSRLNEIKTSLQAFPTKNAAEIIIKESLSQN